MTDESCHHHHRLINSLLSNITNNELNKDAAAFIIPLYMHHLQNTTSSSPALIYEYEKGVTDAILNTTTQQQRLNAAVILFQVESCSFIKQCMIEAGYPKKHLVECDPIYVEFVKNAMNSEMSRINQLVQVIPELAMLSDGNHQEDFRIVGRNDIMDKALIIFQVKVCSILKQAMMQAQFQASETYECTKTYVQFARKALKAELNRISRFDVDHNDFPTENIVIDCNITPEENRVPSLDAFDIELRNLDNLDLNSGVDHIPSVLADNNTPAFEEVNTKNPTNQVMQMESCSVSLEDIPAEQNPTAISIDDDFHTKRRSSKNKRNSRRTHSKEDHRSGQINAQQIREYFSQLSEQDINQLQQQPFIMNPFFQGKYANSAYEQPSHGKRSSSRHKRKKKHRKGKRY